MEDIWSVTELNNYIKELFANRAELQDVVLTAEISNFYQHSASGHMYFTLKDEQTQLKAVMFNRANKALNFKPEDGLKVLAQGRVGVYPARGEYQIYISRLEPEGVGALHLAYEQLKAKLKKEGLFAEKHKRVIPEIPAKIGVITSPTGAAIRDIISVVKRRFANVSLLIAPATVQGDNAEATLLKGLKLLNQLDVDVIIIGRGGGSIEDLWAFNKEKLARTIFNSKTPVISAVGHETDFTIADFVADLRAPTPSAAAELVISNREELERYLKRLENNLEQAINKRLERASDKLSYLTERRAFKLVSENITEQLQQLDEFSRRLEDSFLQNINQKQDKLKSLAAQLNSLSPLNTLARGYNIARKVDGGEVSSISQVEVDDNIELVLKDGKLISKVKEIID